MLVYYDKDDNIWHEKLCLAHRCDSTWTVCTPTFDTYEEDLADNLGMRHLGPRGGLPRNFQGRVFRFDIEALAARQADLLVEGQQLADEEAARGRAQPSTPAPLPVDHDDRRVHAPDAARRGDHDPEDGARGNLREQMVSPDGARGNLGGEAAARVGDRQGAVWVALESREGYRPGEPIACRTDQVTADGDRALVRLAGGAVIAAAALGTYAVPVVEETGTEDLRVLKVQYTRDSL